MKILIIDNNTQHLPNLETSLRKYDVEVRKYRPGMDFSCADKDLVILSGGGGEGLEIHDEHKPGKLWYQDQMNFIKVCDKPIIGICMGFEVISRTFGAKVKKMTKGVEGFMAVNTTTDGQKLFAKELLEQFEAHDWYVPEAPTDFKVLAKSKIGIEIIKHQSRPIIATQFHPEKGGSLNLKELIAGLAS